VPFQINILRWA